MGLTRNVEALSAAANLTDDDVDAKALWASVTETRFPGAVLPIRKDGALIVYAAAETAPEWRRLQPLLLAFVGPTLTDFGGPPSTIDVTSAFEAALLETPLHAFARIRPGLTGQLEKWTIAALRRLQTRIAAAPDLATARPEPTSRLLAQLRDALNVGDLDEAWRLHGVLSRELRLDALNLLQLEMLILSEEGRWAEITAHERFQILCHGEPTPATAAVLLTALARVHFAHVPDEDTAAARHAWLGVAAHARPLLRLANVDNPDIARLRALAAPAGRPQTSSVEAQPRETFVDRSLIDLEASVSALARPAIVAAAISAETDGATRSVWAVATVARLQRDVSDDDVDQPSGWPEWLARIGDSSFPALEHAACAPDLWRLTDKEIDPAEAAMLAGAILDVPDGLAGERFCAALPYLAQWAHEDPLWPRAALARVYVAALTRTALGARRGAPAMRSAALFLEGALACGLDGPEYIETLESAREIARVGLTVESVYAALDLLDIAWRSEAVVERALSAFVFGTLSDIAKLRERLTLGQRLVASQIGARFGWTDAADATTLEGDLPLKAAVSRLAVGVYTLTESAGRQARSYLETAAPGVRVLLNHDHGGSTALAAIARNVDLFVIAATSAKHAATDFIRSKRGDRPLVYAAGRGAASVIRAVEQWIASSA